MLWLSSNEWFDWWSASDFYIRRIVGNINDAVVHMCTKAHIWIGSFGEEMKRKIVATPMIECLPFTASIYFCQFAFSLCIQMYYPQMYVIHRMDVEVVESFAVQLVHHYDFILFIVPLCTFVFSNYRFVHGIESNQKRFGGVKQLGCKWREINCVFCKTCTITLLHNWNYYF